MTPGLRSRRFGTSWAEAIQGSWLFFDQISTQYYQ
jgi:hypothetical protein